MLTARLILEAQCHAQTTFVTLTYNDASLPRLKSNGRATLVPKHADLWLHRVRKHKNILPFRYYLCGEYGEQAGERPHYHALLFGIGNNAAEEAVHDTWAARGLGFVQTSEVHEAHPAYVARYTTKKITSQAQELEWLDGRHKEFNRRSRMPGLGANAVPALAEAYEKPSGIEHLIQHKDIIPTFMHQGKMWPLDDFMKDRIRAHIGIPKPIKAFVTEDTPQEKREWLSGVADVVEERDEISPERQKFAAVKEERIRRSSVPHGTL